MAGQDELIQLEAERDRLLSMIAHHRRHFPGIPPGRAPGWFVVVAMAIICGIGALIIEGLFAGQIALSSFIFLVVGLPLSAYILSRRTTVSGRAISVFEMIVRIERPAGEPEAYRRLADCEARIMKLKESHS
jgi:hypothetical protein